MFSIVSRVGFGFASIVVGAGVAGMVLEASMIGNMKSTMTRVFHSLVASISLSLLVIWLSSAVDSISGKYAGLVM